MVKAGQRRGRKQTDVTPAADAARPPGGGPRRRGRVAARSVRRAGVILVLAGFVLGGAAVAPSPLAPEAFAAGASTGWSIVPSPNGARNGDNTLVQAAAGPAANAWAVGYDNAAGNFRTLIQRWNGAGWVVVASPPTRWFTSPDQRPRRAGIN